MPPRSLGARAFDTFAAPRRLFARLGDAMPWVDVLALTTLGAVLVAATQPPELFLEQMEGAVTRRGEPVQITSPPAEIVRYGRMLAMLSALVGHPIIAFGTAGILTLIFGLLGRGAAGFRPCLVIASHALLIPVAGSLAVNLIALLAGQRLDPSLALLAPGRDEGGMVYHLLASINIFQVWMLGVLAAGVHALDRRFSWARAGLILLALYLALALLAALIMAR